MQQQTGWRRSRTSRTDTAIDHAKWKSRRGRKYVREIPRFWFSPSYRVYFVLFPLPPPLLLRRRYLPLLLLLLPPPPLLRNDIGAYKVYKAYKVASRNARLATVATAKSISLNESPTPPSVYQRIRTIESHEILARESPGR